MSETISPNTICQYTVVSKICEGGMGEVWRARDGRLDRNVAIKILPPNFTDADRLKRFEQEARATSALNHPNILKTLGRMTVRRISSPVTVPQLQPRVTRDGYSADPVTFDRQGHSLFVVKSSGK